MVDPVGNQLPILLISFAYGLDAAATGWESVTNPLDKLCKVSQAREKRLGISYQSS